MFKLVSIPSSYCDICGKSAGWKRCLSCGKHLCGDCAKTNMVEHECGPRGQYRHVEFCIDCDSRLAADRSDPLRNIAMTMASLKQEAEAFYRNFESRARKAEEVFEFHESSRKKKFKEQDAEVEQRLLAEQEAKWTGSPSTGRSTA